MAREQAQDWVDARQAPVRARDLIALLGANVALAVGPWFVRMTEVGPTSSAFWRMTLALPVLFILAWRFGGGVHVKRGHLGWLAFAGLFFAVDIASWHFGILATKLANATLLGNAASLLFPIWGFLVMRAWPSRMHGVALMLAMAGAALLMGRSYQLSAQYFIGDLLCLTAGICYTVYLVGIDRVRGTVPPWSVLALSTAASAIPLLIAAIAFGERIWPSDWTPLIGLAVMSQIVGQGLLVLVLGRLSPLLIGLAFLTQPFIAALIGWLAYNERLATADWIGAGLIGMALVLVRQPGGVPK